MSSTIVTKGWKILFKIISISLDTSNRVEWLVSSRPEANLPPKLKNMRNTSPAKGNTLVELDMQSQKGRIEKCIGQKLSNLADPKRSRVAASYAPAILATVSHA